MAGETVGAEFPPFVQPPYELHGPSEQGGAWSIWGTGWAIPVLAWGTESNMRRLMELLSGSVPAIPVCRDENPPDAFPGQGVVTDPLAAAHREGWDAALAAVREAYGECRDDGSGVCAGHGELLFDGSCEDGPPRFLDQLAAGPLP